MKRCNVLLGSIAVLAAIGCAAKKQLSADEYFRQASEHFRQGAYGAAVEQYRELLDQHPFSEYSEEAELRVAHAHYLNRSCPEAIAALTDFQRRHPTSPHLPFVGHLLGQCSERQMRPPDRDQSASQNAHAYYQAVVQQYPDSPFADLAEAQVDRCRERLAQHELLVAEFYSRRGNTKAVEYRLLDLVNRFNDTDAAGEALYALGRLYREQGADGRAVLAFAAMTHHHPHNGLAGKARRALAKLAGPEDLPAGDPLVVLKARTGRSRSLALARVAEPPAPATPPTGPAFTPGGTGLPGGLGPLDGRY